jgi:hypothetical protein
METEGEGIKEGHKALIFYGNKKIVNHKAEFSNFR